MILYCDFAQIEALVLIKLKPQVDIKDFRVLIGRNLILW